MPGFGADLGFVAVAVVVAAAIWFSARRRWRMAVARREEVRRLAWLAAEEARRAEAEAASLAYVAPPLAPPMAVVDDSGASGGRGKIGVGDWGMPPVPVIPALPPQCAVCYRYTTTRCSRCKAVRYCSGKCQIMHWRQGHKDECHPPRIDDGNNDGDDLSNLKGLQTSQSDLSESSVEINTKVQPKLLDTSSARLLPESKSSSVVFSEDHIEVKPDVSEADGNSDSSVESSLSSSASSSTCSTFSRLLETSDDASANDNGDVLHYGKMEDASCNDISPEEPITAVNTIKVNPKNDPLVSTWLSGNNLSCTRNIEQKVHSSKVDDAKCLSSGLSGSRLIVSDNRTKARPPKVGESKHDHVQMVSASSLQGSSNLLPTETRAATEDSSCRVSSSECTAQFNHRHSVALGTDSSSSVASGRNTDVWLLKTKSSRPPSSFSSVDHESSNGGSHSVSCDMSMKNDNVPEPCRKSVETTGSVPNGINDLKTSVRKVVQHIKSSHLSKHSLGPRSDISGKHKMLFPYELFIKLYNEKVEMRPCGLANCGNSCYANSVFQCLAFTRPLTSYLLQGLHGDTCPRRDWCFTCEFASLVVKAKRGQSPLSPIGILSHIHNIGSNFGPGRQEDAHEFLRYAIDTMQSVCLKEAGITAAGTLAEETTLIQLMFGGYLRSKIKCTKCRGKSERRERMMDLTVEIHGDIGTLEDALARFTATEILDGENKYHCNRCKSYERAKKKLTVLEAPNVLTIALKRFQSGKFGKLNKAVRFPEILDLAPFMSESDDKSPVYSLYAVVVHQDIMNAAFSGHYVCYVKSTLGKWYKTDDSRVKPVDIGRVLTNNAYMLFYARCSPRAPSLIRSAISHDHPKIRRAKDNDSILSRNAPSVAQHRSYDHPHRLHGHHSVSFQSTDPFSGRLPFRRTDSSSDSSSLLSCSDEGSCSTDSTRDSTSTEELSEYIFGGSGRFSRNSSSAYSEDSDGFVSSPLISRHNFAGEGEVLSYGERLGWERGEGVSLEGSRGSPQFLYSDTTTNQCRKLTGDCRDRETDRGLESNVLVRRSSTARERRAH